MELRRGMSLAGLTGGCLSALAVFVFVVLFWGAMYQPGIDHPAGTLIGGLIVGTIAASGVFFLFWAFFFILGHILWEIKGGPSAANPRPQFGKTQHLGGHSQVPETTDPVTPAKQSNTSDLDGDGPALSQNSQKLLIRDRIRWISPSELPDGCWMFILAVAFILLNIILNAAGCYDGPPGRDPMDMWNL